MFHPLCVYVCMIVLVQQLRQNSATTHTHTYDSLVYTWLSQLMERDTRTKYDTCSNRKLFAITKNKQKHKHIQTNKCCCDSLSYRKTKTKNKGEKGREKKKQAS